MRYDIGYFDLEACRFSAGHNSGFKLQTKRQLD